MPDAPLALTNERLKTPRAAGLAGILFAALFAGSIVLIRLAIPPELGDQGAWLHERAGSVAVGLGLVPFAGIAFLWFMGVVRDRIGFREDQFFSTVFFGSGLLFLAMTFVSAALAGGLLTAHSVEAGRVIDSGLYTLVRAVMLRISNAYAVKMAGVFMISLATIAMRTRVMPRGLTVASYALALILLLSIGRSLWVLLIFPVWVCAVSVYILVSNLRRDPIEEKPV
ncbi:MAG TPA: hypothetical protein VII72_03775 [Myxococcota bacterium]|jgi:type IV secretory pathway TrbD component